jgi:glycosyltransferase involved in cell wall biosynthesis
MNFYLNKYGLHEAFISEKPTQDLFMSVVIPCYNETELLTCLQSLYDCEKTKLPVEVIVVVNNSKNASNEIKIQNEKTFSEAIEWEKSHRKENLKFHFIKIELPEKDAGVGLARKIGMDEAVRRFDLAAQNDGILVCFDADCTCEKNYLSEIEKHFLGNKKTPAACIYFEHRFDSLPEKEKNAIIHYETFLRYYVNCLRFAGHPFAYETIGSSMAVRSSVYQKQGGMNKRKAGEDFYFLQKIFTLGNFSEINSTCVYPSARTSDRVPFGTGKAVGDHLTGKELLFYDPGIFSELKLFLDEIRKQGYTKNELMESFPETLRKFMTEFHLLQKIIEIRSNVKDEKQFVIRFFNWFDGFMCLRFSHYYSDHFSPRKQIQQTDFSFINPLLSELRGVELLTSLRQIDRNFKVK